MARASRWCSWPQEISWTQCLTPWRLWSRSLTRCGIAGCRTRPWRNVSARAQTEQRDSARPWTAVKGPFGAAVATLKRLQWVILEYDPFLWCMQDGRIVDPRRVCPHSMLILLRRAARAWQWRRVALHEGYKGLDRGAVFGPLYAAMHSPKLSMPEKAYLRSVVLDAQWTQQRKFRAARAMSPLLCALRQ